MYKNLIEQFDLNEQRLEQLIAVSEIKTFKKNSLLLENGIHCDWVAAIIEGAVRTYVTNEKGEEISYLLQVNDDYIGDYESFITNEKSKFNLKTCLDSTCLFIFKNHLIQLAENDIFWLHFYKKISDFCFLDAKRRIDELLFFTPEERYLNLLAKGPEIIKKIPQKYISSYLGITPQSLSRIRNRIS